jgi:prepilin-type N-terminal cleavage/methylation domain-containing protein
MYVHRSTRVSAEGFYLQNIRQFSASTQGFTFVELILVVVLISVLSVSFLPKFFDTGSISVEGAAAMVSADIRYTQELAMGTHSSKTIVFTATNTYYTVDSKNVNLPSHVSISSGATFIFNSLGEPTTGGGSSVTLSAGTDTKTITVDSHTGRVWSS